MGSQLRVGRSRQQERETAGRMAPPVVTKQEMNARARLSFFLSAWNSGPREGVLPTCRMGLLASAIPICQLPHRHAHRFLS